MNLLEFKVFIIALIIAIVSMFTGCATPERVVYVKTPVYKYEHLPKELVDVNITTPKPFGNKEFVGAKPIEREKLLTKLVIDLYQTIGKYKTTLLKIKEFDEKYNKKVNEVIKQNK